MKKLFFILSAAAALAAAAFFASIEFAALLAVAILFFTLLPRLLLLALDWQEKYELQCWKKAIEEQKKVKERIAKICREVPQEHFV